MTDIITFAFTHFDHPLILSAIPLSILLLAFLCFKDFLTFKDEQPDAKRKRKKLKILLFISRTIIFSLLIIALASPFTEITKTVPGSPKVKILIDNSTSMRLYPAGLAEELKNKLEEQIPVETDTLAEADQSALGSKLLSSIKRDDNILLISDGYVTDGTPLGDAALYASTINTTLNAIRLEAEQHDTAVRILGPDKVTANAENTFSVKISQTQKRPVKISIQIDGTTIYNQETDSEEVQFKHTFTDGYHQVTATIQADDHFPQNQKFHKTVKVVPKTKVLLWTERESPLEALLTPVYDLTRTSSLPADLKPYTAAILNDLPAGSITNAIDRLTSYTLEGNGLVVIGGDSSYDVGGYKGSRLEQILPVFVAQPGKKKGDINVVLIIDISASTGARYGDDKTVDIEKSIALGILKDLSLINKVGAVAFNTEVYTLGEIKPLLEHTDLEDKISRLIDFGGTHIGIGILKATEMLQNQKGSKNIILVSDGKTQNADQAEDAAKLASSQGIRIYTIGVGPGTNENTLKTYAALSNGAYYRPEARQGIKILFGDTETSGSRRVMPYVFVDQDHFISQGLEPKGNIFGFNVVAPKDTAKLIATTDVGDPLLAAGRFGLGRVASLATDDGTLYAPELLNKDNSRIYTRTINWAIGDPERKNERFIQISDARTGENLDILVKQPQEPAIDGASFIKIDENLWSGTKLAEQEGFHTLAQTTYAVNYPSEYERVGQNPELENIITTTGGKMFNKDDIDAIVEHVRARSRRQILEKKPYAWIFTLTAMTLFLLEVGARRIIRNFYK